MTKKKTLSKETTKKKIGRPDHYDPSMCDKLVLMMTEGWSKTEVAAALNLSNRETIDEYAKKYPEFGGALKRGLLHSEAWWLKNGRENIRNKEFNSGLWFMNMKNRFGWRDKIENKTTVTVSQEEALKELE